MIRRASNRINYHTGTEEKVPCCWHRQEKRHLDSNTCVQEQKARPISNTLCTRFCLETCCSPWQEASYLNKIFLTFPRKKHQPMENMPAKFPINNLFALCKSVKIAPRSYWLQVTVHNNPSRCKLCLNSAQKYCFWAVSECFSQPQHSSCATMSALQCKQTLHWELQNASGSPINSAVQRQTLKTFSYNPILNGPNHWQVKCNEGSEITTHLLIQEYASWGPGWERKERKRKH